MPKPTIRQRLASWLAPETRAVGGVGYSDYGFGGSFGRSTIAGTTINSRTALSISAVWAAVNCYTSTIGALDLYVAERDARGGRRPAPYHPAFDLIRSRPNPHSTSMRFRQAWLGHALTYGNGYAEIVWDAKGRKPLELCLMDPRDVEPYDDHGSLMYRQKSGGPDLPAEDVLHLAFFGFDGIKGYSAITIGAETLGVAAAQRDYQGGLFGNSAGIQGHLEIPGKLNATAKAEMLSQWEQRHQGPQGAGMTGILDNGARWVRTAFSPQDADLILGANFSVAEIARFFNLPPHKLGLLEKASYSTVEQANIDFTQTSVMPWLKAIEQEMDNKLLGRIERQSFFIAHDLGSLLRGDTAAQTSQEKSDIDTGIRSINEIRIARGYEPVDNPRADYHWVQAVSNLEAIEDMGKAPTIPADVSSEPATPVPPPEATLAAMRDVLIDAVGRMVRRECGAVRKAAGKDRLDGWIEEFYPSHAATVTDAIAPAVRALATMSGRPVEPALVIASNMATDSRRQLRDLMVCHPPDEMPDVVDRLCARWEAERAAAIVDELIGARP